MNTRLYLRTVFALALSGIWLFYASGVVAEPSGISGFSGASGSTCTVCHPSGVNPSVSLAASSGSTTVSPGSTTSYMFTLSGGPANNAGLDIRASAGSLIDTNASGTRILNSELVHSSPNNVSGGSITWSFDWQAPSTPGTYTIFATGLSGDGNGGTSGDSTGATTLQVTVAQATNQAPVAVISAPTSGAEGVAVSFNGSGSSDPDGTIAAYDWDFGDGSNATGSQVTHAFAAGTYTVTLTVTDNNGATDSASMQIQIAATNVPPLANISGPSNGTEGVAVNFDGSGSTDSDGNIVSYDWDFGDNSAGSGVTTSHVYAAGTYTVTLMVTDNGGDIDHATLNINIVPATNPQPPVADAGGPYSGTVGMAVQFDGSGSTDPDGSVTNYSWDFGDGNSGTGVGPVHIYNAPGNYTVQLTVTDDSGDTGSSQTTADIVAVPPPPQAPVADAGGPYTGTAGVAVQFDGSGSTDPDGNIVSYAWDFGDGNSGNGINPMHTYTTAGTYTVLLTVTDDSGDTNSNQTTAEIGATEPPPPPPPPPTDTDGEALYNTYCASCHGAKGTREFRREVAGEDAGDIVEAIDEEKDMNFLDNILTSDDIDAIAAYINDTTPPGDGGDTDPPPTDGDHDSDHDSDHSDDGDHDGDHYSDHSDGDSHDSSDGKSDDDDEKPSDMSNKNPFDDEDSKDNKKRSFDELGAGALHWLVLALAAVMVHRRRRIAINK